MTQTIAASTNTRRDGRRGHRARRPGIRRGPAGVERGYRPSPRVIARCASSDDAVAAVGLARDSGLDVAIRSGAHSISGLSTTDGAW